MRVTRKARVKIERNEIRLGNFFLKDENDHYRLQDINTVFSHRIWKRIPAGLWIYNMLHLPDRQGYKSLQTYIAAMWSLFSVVPDDQFMQDVLRIAKEALERHPDWYGVKKDATEEDDEKAVEEVKAVKEMEEAIRNIGDGE